MLQEGFIHLPPEISNPQLIDFPQPAKTFISGIENNSWMDTVGACFLDNHGPIPAGRQIFFCDTQLRAKAIKSNPGRGEVWETIKSQASDIALLLGIKPLFDSIYTTTNKVITHNSVRNPNLIEKVQEKLPRLPGFSSPIEMILYNEAILSFSYDAALYNAVVNLDLPIEPTSKDHLERRMNIWRSGFGVRGDSFGGTLYVFKSCF